MCGGLCGELLGVLHQTTLNRLFCERAACIDLIARRFVKPKCGAKRCANSRFFGQDLGGIKAVFKAKLKPRFCGSGGSFFGVISKAAFKGRSSSGASLTAVPRQF